MKALALALVAGLFAFPALGAQPCEHGDDARHLEASATAGTVTQAAGGHDGHEAASASAVEDTSVGGCCGDTGSEAPPCPQSCGCVAHASGAALGGATLRCASASPAGSPAEPSATPQASWAQSLDTPPPRD